MMSYTHLLVGITTEDLTEIEPYSKSHSILQTVKAFSGVKLDMDIFPPFVIRTKPKIVVLQRNS